MKAEGGNGRKARFVHLGDRLNAIDRIRSGALTVDRAARELGVTPEEVVEWQQLHAFERTLSFDELRGERSPQLQRLSRRAQHLSELVGIADRELRELHQEFMRQAISSNEPYPAGRAAIKKVG